MKLRPPRQQTLSLFDSQSPLDPLPGYSSIRTWIDPDEPFADNFAGGGGVRVAINWAVEELALKRHAQDVAVNHWRGALAMYRANHPACRTYCEDITKVDPVAASGGRRFALAWFSPTCIFFSQAKGGPLDENATKVRGLCWLANTWASSAAKPRVLCMENVKQFVQFGPLHRHHNNGCSSDVAVANGHELAIARGKDPDKAKPRCLKHCCYLRPIKARKGTLYNAFIRRLSTYYRYVETRILKAHHFGAPTSRERWFLIASDEPITWPTPTHGPDRLPYRTAAQCIDWSIQCPSIFERRKPLVKKTADRLRAGIHRFVFGAARPFIVPTSYGDKGGNDVRVSSADEPLRTIAGNRSGLAVVSPMVTRTAMHMSNALGVRDANQDPLPTITTDGGLGVVAPMIMKAKTYGGGGNDAKSADVPLGTITTSKRGEHALATPVMVRTAFGDVDTNGKRRGRGAHHVETPIGTVKTSGDHAIATPYLVHRSNGERAGQAPRVYDAQKPVGTIVASTAQKHGLVAPVLVKNYSEREGGFAGGQRIDAPAGSITARDHHALAAVQMAKLRGTSDAHIHASATAPDEPLDTISASGTHHAITAAYLIRYNGQSGPANANEPISTIDTKDRFAVIHLELAREVETKARRVAEFLGFDAPIILEIDGVEWVLVDIGFRMLTPRELFRCQGFPESYIIDADLDGKPLTKTAQIKCVGNSVPPPLAKAIVVAALRSVRYEPEMRRAA